MQTVGKQHYYKKYDFNGTAPHMPHRMFDNNGSRIGAIICGLVLSFSINFEEIMQLFNTNVFTFINTLTMVEFAELAWKATIFAGTAFCGGIIGKAGGHFFSWVWDESKRKVREFKEKRKMKK